MKKSIFILVDADNISYSILSKTLTLMESKNVINDIKRVIIIGKNEICCNYYKTLFEEKGILKGLIDIKISKAIKNHSDIITAYFLGKIAGRHENNLNNVIFMLITFDKLILEASKECLSSGANLWIFKETSKIFNDVRLNNIDFLNVNLEHDRKKKGTSIHQMMLPKWYYSQDQTDTIGLVCNATPRIDNQYPLKFIPFPEGKDIVTLGSKRSDLDIELYFWENSGKQSLYSPHVEFRYLCFPKSFWTIRSTKGFRRGYKQVIVNGIHIDASHGLIRINNNSNIVIGMFDFCFVSNGKLELLWFEDPKVLIEKIEKKLKDLGSKIGIEKFPLKVKEEITINNITSLENAHFRHYYEILFDNWTEFVVINSLQLFQKENFGREFFEINRIRNIVMHPSRKPLTKIDKEKLVEFYLKLFHGEENNI